MIVNTPSAEMTATHLVVLKALLAPKIVEKFISTFGKPAIVAVKMATRTIPNKLPDVPSAQAVRLTGDVLKRDLHFDVDQY